MKAAAALLVSLSITSLLGACGSGAPIRYYTLVRPLDAGSPRQGLSGVELVSVQVPAQADHPQLVVRQGAERVELVETQQWIAPLPEEIRAGLEARLDVRVPPSAERLRLDLQVTRFESVLDRYALIEAHWQLHLKNGTPLTCSSRSVQNVAPGFDALVAGHQRALDQIADEIARSARGFSASAACPAF